jgi:hypothetical protein
LTKQRPAVGAEAANSEEWKLALAILQPSTKPGSLGRLGHHEVLEVLGQGGFGLVVRVFDELLQRVVAVKLLSPQLATTSPARKRFLREARAAARVRHENVVQIHAVEEKPLPYLVMEYIPGRTLQQMIDETGPLEVPDVLYIGAQIARGLAAAHHEGLIHRDIKPGNILLESRVGNKVKITDFGLARAADDASVSQSGVISGTPLYMAPEQARGEPLDHRADLFSFGSVLYTMVSGRPPFRAGTAFAVLKRVAEDTPRPIREIIPEVPQWLCDLIIKLQAKDPARRFQSAAEVAEVLERHLAQVREAAPAARPDSLQAERRRKPRVAAMLVASAIGLTVLGGAVFTYPRWRLDGPASGTPVPDRPGNGAGPGRIPAQEERVAAEPLSSHEVRGRASLIDFTESERNFSAVGRDNGLRRTKQQCNALLVRFDLAKVSIPAKARLAKASVSFFVWDPSAHGKTKVCAFPMKSAWDEATVTWKQPAAGKTWSGGEGFAFGVDTGAAGNAVVVEPDAPGTDTVEPPIEHRIDVTELARAWLNGEPNFGLAIAPVIDPSVDENFFTRFQVYGSGYERTQYTPKLTVEMAR